MMEPAAEMKQCYVDKEDCRLEMSSWLMQSIKGISTRMGVLYHGYEVRLMELFEEIVNNNGHNKNKDDRKEEEPAEALPARKLQRELRNLEFSYRQHKNFKPGVMINMQKETLDSLVVNCPRRLENS
ncbi:hypothetical protein F0562_023869 [Nyssa sinensis]|uniref:Uncharacterized protein n=1 Tax=Nyssa sinensis TaxID=561372 RepID=A0A5J5BLQ2_9ASTE|nr:hypothetical protein F0562_023869 [Nyssa sinensis]